jgi:delta8-fatty-acid desaturase
MSTVNISPFFSTRWLRNFDSKILDRWDDYYAPLLDDWFHGGLNLHIEHHTMPKLPRHSLREANRRLQHVCRRNGIYFDERHFLQAVWDTLVHMSEVSQKANFSSSMKHN